MSVHPTTSTAVRTATLPSGEVIPVLGQGTWGMAEDAERRADEIAALRLGLDLGMTLIDTAEMYAGGAAEQLVAKAIAGRRSEVCSSGSCGKNSKRIRRNPVTLPPSHGSSTDSTPARKQRQSPSHGITKRKAL